MKVKVIQQWAIIYNMIAYATGCEFEADEQTAAELIAEKRVIEVKSLKTDAKTAPEQADSPETSEQEDQDERQAKIKAAVAEMLTADPNAMPKCPDIAAKTGLLNIRKEERDNAVAAFKQAATGYKTEESKGE